MGTPYLWSCSGDVAADRVVKMVSRFRVEQAEQVRRNSFAPTRGRALVAGAGTAFDLSGSAYSPTVYIAGSSSMNDDCEELRRDSQAVASDFVAALSRIGKA